jgi:hypothetical protein
MVQKLDLSMEVFWTQGSICPCNYRGILRPKHQYMDLSVPVLRSPGFNIHVYRQCHTEAQDFVYTSASSSWDAQNIALNRRKLNLRVQDIVTNGGVAWHTKRGFGLETDLCHSYNTSLQIQSLALPPHATRHTPHSNTSQARVRLRLLLERCPVLCSSGIWNSSMEQLRRLCNYRAHVPQQIGYQGTSICVVPGTLSRKQLPKMSQYVPPK